MNVQQIKIEDQITALKNILACIVKNRENINKEKEVKRPQKIMGKVKTSYWSSSSYYYERDKEVCQLSHQTRVERFPKLYDRAKELIPNAQRILSFGCSTGEEVQALAARFPLAEIVGFDIDYYTVKTARYKNKLSNVFFTDELECTGKYDLITCFQVLFSLETVIDKKRWTAAINKMDRHLSPGGICMVFTSEHDPGEILTTDKYEVIKTWKRIHNKNKKEYFCGYYRKKVVGV